MKIMEKKMTIDEDHVEEGDNEEENEDVKEDEGHLG